MQFIYVKCSKGKDNVQPSDIQRAVWFYRGIFPYMDEIFKGWLKIIDDYVVPFLRTKNGMYIVCAVIVVLLIVI